MAGNLVTINAVKSIDCVMVFSRELEGGGGPDRQGQELLTKERVKRLKLLILKMKAVSVNADGVMRRMKCELKQ